MSIIQKSVEVAYALFDKKRPSHDPRCFVVCCAYYKNRLLTVEVNSNRTDPNNLRNPLICRKSGRIIEKTKCCAEWNTIKRIKNTSNIPFDKISLVNIRITFDREIGYSRACSSCRNIFRLFEPKKVFYSVSGNNTNYVFEEDVDF